MLLFVVICGKCKIDADCSKEYICVKKACVCHDGFVYNVEVGLCVDESNAALFYSDPTETNRWITLYPSGLGIPARGPNYGYLFEQDLQVTVHACTHTLFHGHVHAPTHSVPLTYIHTRTPTNTHIPNGTYTYI